ncbi:MAG: hypothetical protein QNJ40_16705 [Xanthomonadales bacterium]|nr:hypothetical protein [Xanthomonadales bacterium]
MSFFEELKRRNVFRVGIAYIVTGWVVLQAADFALDLIAAPNWVIQVFVLAVAIGLPIALFFAWAYELTPEGLKKESEVDREQSITPQTGRKLDRWIIGVLAVLIVILGVERFFFAGQQAPTEATPVVASVTEKSIAVLPFADLSQNQDQGWFADGLAEEILNALVRVPDLSVAARTSSFQFKGVNEDIPSIAEKLGVAHVLEGSVRSAGNRIRVTAQLIRASDGFHLWSENYDRDVSDMISIQEDLAQNIARALETSLDPAALAEMARVGTDSIEAYQEYLKGLQVMMETFRNVGDASNLARSYEHFEKARAIDPGFAQAHIYAANFWKVQLAPTRTDTGGLDLSAEDKLREYHERIGLAINNARTDTDRLRSLADRASVDLRWNEARRLFQQYLALRPNDEDARFQYTGILGMVSDVEGWLAEAEHMKVKALTDEYVAGILVNDGYRYLNPSEAAEIALKAVSRWPNSGGMLYQAHRTLLWAEQYEKAAEIREMFKSLVPEPDPLVETRHACANGDRAAAEAILAEISPDRNNYVSMVWLIHNMLGNTEQEVETLRPFAESGVPYQLADFLTYHKFDPTPFPSLMAILEREGVTRKAPVKPPFQCPPAQ